VPDVLVQSFDHDAVRLLKAHEPGLPVGLIGKPRRARLPQLGTWVAAVNPHHASVDAGYVEAVHAAGMRCLVWTPNSERAVRRALRNGVDGVITDRPAAFRALVREPVTV
jgi:glycerophosphoryl diester phosphodiesterase